MITANKKILSQLQNLSTENLIIWIVGRSKELDRVLTIEEIVLEAWEINPEKHSMRGYPHYPDSFVIMKRIYDMKGRKGYIGGASNSGFKLTPLSLAKFEDLKYLISNNNIVEKKSKNASDRTISSIDEAPYKKLIKSPAYIKYTTGKVEQIVETDFLYFYGINWHSKPTMASNKMKNVDKVVDQFGKKDPTLKMVYAYLNQNFSDVKQRILNN